MNIQTYLNSLHSDLTNSPNQNRRNIQKKILYARAYHQGAEALEKYRDKLIAEKINAVVNHDAQLAILFNKDKHPDEHEAYQNLRIKKKEEADAELAILKQELEEILNTQECNNER